jgi:hypothetical protein
MTTSDEQIAKARAYGAIAFARFLAEYELSDTQRDLIRAMLAMAWLEGAKETADYLIEASQS